MSTRLPKRLWMPLRRVSQGSGSRSRRARAAFARLCSATIAMLIGLFPTPTLAFPTPVQPEPWSFQLPDAQGRTHSRAEFRGAKAVVFLFVATECPISNRYAPDLVRMAADYRKRDVLFFAVNSDPAVKPEQVLSHSKDYGYTFPVLLDPKQNLAARFGVSLTPTMVVINPSGEMSYRGRIDNRYLDFGKYRSAGIISDGRLAIDAALAGQSSSATTNRPIGCALPPPVRDSGTSDGN